jgi:hypothetical protein
VNSIFHFSYFDPDYPTVGLTVTGLARVYCIIAAVGTYVLTGDAYNSQVFRQINTANRRSLFLRTKSINF